MASEPAQLQLPRLYPVNRLQPLVGAPIILSLVEITAEFTIVRTRSTAHRDPLVSRIGISLRDDTGVTYQWTQAIAGGGVMADVRSDVFAGAPLLAAKLLLVTIRIDHHPHLAETVIDLASPFA